MLHTFMSVLLRPFITLVFLTIAWGAAKLLDRVIPEGRVKRFLYKPRGVH